MKQMDKKNSFWRVNWIRKLLYKFFCKLQHFRLHASVHEPTRSVKSTTKKDLDFAMLHLAFSVHVFLVT